MWSSKSHNYDKKPENSPGIDHLYGSNNFVADSLGATLASSVKISADGKITIQNVGFVGDRHIHPDLQLPDLKERCNFATTGDLYHLSTLLADNGTDSIPAKAICLLDVDNGKTLQAKSTHTGQPWDTSTPLPKTNLEQTTRHTTIAAAELERELEKMEDVEQKKSVEKIKYDVKSTSARISLSHPEFNKPSKLMNYMSNSSNEELPDTGSSASPTNRWKAAEKDCARRRIKREFIYHRVEILHVAKEALHFLDKYKYIYMNVMLLCSVFYMGYVIFDVLAIDTVERCYMLKMRSSGFVLKCYYYIMRLLNVPIF